MKNVKRISKTALASGLAFAMALSLLPANANFAKAKKATLKSKSITVKVGKSKTIGIKNKNKKAKYAFKSSKKAVATVSKKGAVKGIKKGSATITVKETKGKKTTTVGKVKVKVTETASVVQSQAPVVTEAPQTVTPAPVATNTPAPTAAGTATPKPTKTPTPTLSPEQILEKTETKKAVGEYNPISAERYMADPYAIEFEGRIYVYGTNDSQSFVTKNGVIPNNKYSNINTLNCYSTEDMVNWRDEGIIPAAGKNGCATWANNSWAPAVAHKVIDGKDKFFIYFADNGSGIGVLEADSPTGPWKDPIGKQLVSRNTPNVSTVEWLFDPAVLVDDDGQGYLYFGGIGNAKDREHPNCQRVVKLGDDMISLKEDPVVIDAPAPFEDSGINKFNGKYYYSYCTNWDGADKRPTTNKLGAASIAYMVSDSPTGPWSDAKVVLKNPTAFFSNLPNNDKNNNHHCMFEYKGQIYMFYHSQKMAADKGITQGYRNSGVDLVTMAENGDITAKMTMKGVPQLKAFNPYQTVEAEEFAWAVGTFTQKGPKHEDTRSNRVLSSIHKNDYIGLQDVDFGTESPKSVSMNIASANGEKVEGKIYVYKTDMTDANKIAEIPVSAGKDYTDMTANLSQNCTGKERLFFVFDVEGILVDTWTFKK